ncbi:hypothetical protein AMAG_05803 [Allomyces macrogynus ATCC 38327]|uniref:Uncharacterized protein n=1 Tax=Allomyces macrogynus (strain ATCC 38327) TaxID=578462 RepID=A0A0L0SD89_ALLM3|nr:hypothetical protein AMAG_05803 [Allomyces macrogynus ATCC 38327]|eukprot:KNE60412.1 hypothetical protein AMAG_05803 [Allomyces macrogynus ATCC 38327]
MTCSDSPQNTAPDPGITPTPTTPSALAAAAATAVDPPPAANSTAPTTRPAGHPPSISTSPARLGTSPTASSLNGTATSSPTTPTARTVSPRTCNPQRAPSSAPNSDATAPHAPSSLATVGRHRSATVLGPSSGTGTRTGSASGTMTRTTTSISRACISAIPGGRAAGEILQRARTATTASAHGSLHDVTPPSSLQSTASTASRVFESLLQSRKHTASSRPGLSTVAGSGTDSESDFPGTPSRPAKPALPEQTRSYRYRNLTVKQILEWITPDNLTVLNLSNNQLPVIPDPICGIQTLRTLSLNWNNLCDLNPKLVQLQALQTLALSANRITDASLLGIAWKDMPNLKRLMLVQNQLKEFPECLLGTKLDTLSLSNNALTHLPDEITNMVHLQWLGLSNNQLRSVAPLRKMHPLSGLTLANNPLEDHDDVTRDLQFFTKVMRVTKTFSIPSPLDTVERARTATNQLDAELMREIARHAATAPPGSPLDAAINPSTLDLVLAGRGGAAPSRSASRTTFSLASKPSMFRKKSKRGGGPIAGATGMTVSTRGPSIVATAGSMFAGMRRPSKGAVAAGSPLSAGGGLMVPGGASNVSGGLPSIASGVAEEGGGGSSVGSLVAPSFIESCTSGASASPGTSVSSTTRLAESLTPTMITAATIGAMGGRIGGDALGGVAEQD